LALKTETDLDDLCEISHDGSGLVDEQKMMVMGNQETWDPDDV
jgi:hypothetical protein